MRRPPHHLAALCSVLLPCSFVQAGVLFEESFDDGNGSTRWTSQSSVGSETLANFNFDYSALGIPAAPHSSGSTTGMALTTNRTEGVPGGISASPTDFKVYGDFTLKFDAWLNYRGPLGSLPMESLRHATFGWGTNGTSAEWTGGTSLGAVLFATSNSGAVSDDFRLILNNTDASDIDFIAGSRDHAAPFYTTLFPSQSAPAAQQGLDTSQTGSTQAGEAGFAWHEIEVRREGRTLTWAINGTIILSKEDPDAFTRGHQIFFGISDTFGMPQTGTLPDLNAFIVDNVVVESIPDPRPVSRSFLLDLSNAEKINPYITDDHGIFSNSLAVGEWNDASRGHNVPISVLSVGGFDNVGTEGNLRLEADLTTWNADNTLIDPQGVRFRFTIHVDGESKRSGGSGFLNGLNLGRLGIDGDNATLGYSIFEENEYATFSVQDIEVLSAPAGHSLSFVNFASPSYWNYTPDMVKETLFPSTLRIDWHNEVGGQGTTGPLGFLLRFELVENISETEIQLQATKIATEAGAVVEIPNFATLVLSGMPAILERWDVETDSPEFFAVPPTIDEFGTLRYKAQPSAGSGYMNIRALDDTGFTAWTTVELINTPTDYTDSLPLEPDTFDSLGTLSITGGIAAELNTNSGVILDTATLTPILSSPQLLVENNGSDPGPIWRVFCVDSMTLDGGTLANITGSYGLAVISQDDITIQSNLTFNGTDGSAGYPSYGGPDGGDGFPGTDGGRIALIANHTLHCGTVTIAARGGKGGEGGYTYSVPEESGNGGHPGDGGTGGNGGGILLSAHYLNSNATLDARGGAGGDLGVGIGVWDLGAVGPGGDGGWIKVRRSAEAGSTTSHVGGGGGEPAGALGQLTMYGGCYFLGPIADFRRQYGLSSQGLDDEADWSGNGIPNLQYFVFDLGDPATNPPASLLQANLPHFELTSTGYQFSYLKPVGAYHLALYPLQSQDMLTWNELDPLEPVVEETLHNENYVRRNYTIGNDAATKRFFRVRALDYRLSVLNAP